MFNKVIMAGNLTADPSFKEVAGNKTVCNLRIAVNSRIKSRDEYKDETLFIGVEVWGKQAIACHEHLSKGRAVLVEGRLVEDQWTTEAGEKRSKMKIAANNVRFIGGGRPDEGQGNNEDVEPF
jgi:single-strand DNA-binding protein